MEKAKRGIVDELHKQARKRFIRRRVYVKGLDDLWQIDLIDMQKHARDNNGHKYILTVIDVFSRYAWAVPVKDKSGVSVTEAMKKVLNGAKRIPKNLQCDNGKEFYNSAFKLLMTSHKINMYSTFSVLKASIVERFNRSLLNWLWKEFNAQGSYRWLKLLPDIVAAYNNRIHRTINMAPAKVTKRHERRLLSVLNRWPTARKRPKFKINDIVRISKYKTLFEKGYTPSWSTELFRVAKVRETVPPVYNLNDFYGQEVRGSFNEPELQKTSYPDIYLVEKVIRKDKKGVYVKFLGLDSSHNGYIKA